MFKKRSGLLLLSIIFVLNVFAQDANRSVALPIMQKTSNLFVDSVYHSLTLQQKIGQLFMIAAYSGGEKYNQTLIEKLILENGVGGLIFMQGTPKAQAEQTNLYQQQSKLPLLIAMDAEWGLGMRLTGVRDFPRQLMLGAMQDSSLVYKMASAIAEQCRIMGVHVNFAPVIDINNNPNNPVINFRSFGEEKMKVANYGLQYMKGLQDNGIIACAKHFPGHGDTDVDSHKDLPEIKKSVEQLKSLEFYPFQKLITEGIQSVMVAHLQIPAIDNREHTPTTLSDKAITDLLKGDMKFNGLVFTDALNMQGIAKFYEPGDIDVKAFKAGNDVLLFSQDVPTGMAKIEAAIKNGIILESQLEESVKKILLAKYQAGLFHREVLKTEDLNEQLNKYISAIRTQVAEAAITLVDDPNQVLEKIKRGVQEIVYVGIGTNSESVFAKELQKAGIDKIVFAPQAKGKQLQQFIRKVSKADAIIVGVHGMTQYAAQNFGLSKDEIYLIKQLALTKKSINILFGNPYALKNFCDDEGFIITYDEVEETQSATAKILSGQLKPQGKLPVSVCENFKAGDGIVSLTSVLGEVIDSAKFVRQNKDIIESTTTVNKLNTNDKALICCVNPSALGINNTELDKLDEYLQSCVNNHAFPGCRMLVAKDGKVFYDKAFGYLDNERKQAVDIHTIYDIASITKVASTTLAIMKLYDEGKIQLDDYLGKYLPIVRNTNKENLKLRDILAHQAGLIAWIPFYKETIDSNKNPMSSIYSKTRTGKFTVRVSDELFMRSDWVDTMWSRILESPLDNKGKYVYSDLGFILLQKVVEQVVGKSLYLYVDEQFYKPLGLKNTAYLPKRNLNGKQIAPSENDEYFRHQKLQGDVHDMAAAMFGGMSGHAGLFTTANDLGIIFQMLLNGGLYQNKRYLKKSTIDLFTAKNSFISRRGLGFDKPETQKGKGSPCADNVSPATFGHQGFTGTCVWADSQHGILYIFLSNRTYPSAENKLISRMNIRERAQTYIYDALGIASGIRK
ncbi:MAG: serine hydrolase [Bacteroidetes bacterium]|nr:serine hydrolase [Bacteroidota bacterium]